MDVVLHDCDRFIREFGAVEAEEHPLPPVENVPVTTYKAAEGQSPADVLAAVLPHRARTWWSFATWSTPKPCGMMCARDRRERRLMIGYDPGEGLRRGVVAGVALGVPPAEFAKAITVVVGQRLVRKLCESCKEAYVAHAANAPAIGHSRRTRPGVLPPAAAESRSSPRSHARRAVRSATWAAPRSSKCSPSATRSARCWPPGAKLDCLRQAARKDGMKSFQEEGVLLVAKGVTSLPELMRVLKQ